MNIPTDRVPGGVNPVDELVRLREDGPDRRPIPPSNPPGRFMCRDPRFAWTRRVLYRLFRCSSHLIAALAYLVDPDVAVPTCRRITIEGELYLARNYAGMARAMIGQRVRDILRTIEQFGERMRGGR